MNQRPHPRTVQSRSPSSKTMPPSASTNYSVFQLSQNLVSQCRVNMRNKSTDSYTNGLSRRTALASGAFRRFPNSRQTFTAGSNTSVTPASGDVVNPICDSSRLPIAVADFDTVRSKIVQATMAAERANALARKQNSNLRYHVSLRVPVKCLNQTKRGNSEMYCEPFIELQRNGVQMRFMSLDRMQENIRKLESNFDGNDETQPSPSDSVSYEPVMFKLNDRYPFNQKVQCMDRSPFDHNSDLILIGVSNVYLRCLLFVTEFSHLAPLISPQGEVFGNVHTTLSANILPNSNSHLPQSQPEYIRDYRNKKSTLPDLIERNGTITSGDLQINVGIKQVTGVPCIFSKMILCHYNIFCHTEPIVVLPKLESYPRDGEPNYEHNSRQKFEKTQTCKFEHLRSFQIPLSSEIINSIADLTLSIEVYGNLANQTLDSGLAGHPVQRMASNAQQKPSDQRKPVTKLRRYKSDLANRPNSANSPHNLAPNYGSSNTMLASHLAEEWLKLQRRIDLWVAIEELMEDGNYKKVPVLPASNVKTGGIYQLRQGLNRRIRILIRPSDLSRKERGTLPLECEAVTQVSVGCVSRSFAEPEVIYEKASEMRLSPDSYQEVDLDRLRQRWCEAMDKWQTYLQENLQQLAKKTDKTSVDEAREGYLLNRWVSSIQERDAILVPPSGSSLPGAPASVTPVAGMEYHNPIIFVDLQRELRKPNQKLSVGETSFLDGEENSYDKGTSFVNLPLVKKYATLIGSVASWDTNLHENDLLNKITSPGDRIYLIVAVQILLSKPALMTLLLRKRICINICKRNAMTSIFRSPFLRMVNNEKDQVLWTGVAYNFVAGIPQMDQHTANQSSPDPLSKDLYSPSAEAYSEQYFRTIQAVNSELYLDGLKQEVALQEAISANQVRRTASGANEMSKLSSTSYLTGQNSPYSESASNSSRSYSAALPQSSRNIQLYPSLHSEDFSLNEYAGNSAIALPKDRTDTQPMDKRAIEKSEENMAWSRREREKNATSND